VIIYSHVGGIAWGSDPVNLARWQARVRVQALLSNGKKASAVRVTVRFGNGVVTGCTTDSNGQCAVALQVDAKVAEMRMQVTSLSAQGSVYKPESNRVSVVTTKRPAIYNFFRWFLW
jgi:hypothetical protein